MVRREATRPTTWNTGQVDAEPEIEPEKTAVETVETVETVEATIILPWWRSRLNLAVIALAVAVLFGGLGYVVGNNQALPDPTATDNGFLQDMRYHHEQAVQISLIFINTIETDPDLRTIAREIIIGQNIEIGRMIQMLRDFGQPEANQSDLAMGWMGGSPMALDSMPGLASESDLGALRHARADDANVMFVRLMTAHHEGGIHMAERAATHAGSSEVRAMAASMVSSQRNEIAELAVLLAAAQDA